MENKTKFNYLIILPVVLIIGYTISVFVLNSNWRLGFIFLISTKFGFILKFGGIGYNRAFKAVVKDLNFYYMRLLFVIAFFTNIFCNIIYAINVCPLFFPERKKYFKYSPSLAPVGLSLMIGATLFGIGMNMATCCASGTFMRLGTGNVKTIVVLIFFICGSTFSVINPIYNSHTSLPKFNSIKLHWAVTLTLLIVLYVITLGIDYIKYRKGMTVKDADFIFFSKILKCKTTEDKEAKNKWVQQIFFCIGLALTMAVFYLCFGYMFGISGPLPIIGANFLSIFGAKPENWDAFKKPLEKNPIKIIMFNSDVYIFLGSFLSSAIQGVFGKEQENTIYYYIRACIGGFLMGVGAKLAYGCNIGGMTSGIAGNSLHGFIWMIFALFGSWFSNVILEIIEIFTGINQPVAKKEVLIKEEEPGAIDVINDKSDDLILK